MKTISPRLLPDTNTTKGVLLLIIVFAVFAFRRPDQLLHPYMWVEEGTVFLPQYISYGWLSIFAPVAGYLLVPAKIIFLIATKVSFLYQPVISYWLTLLFTFGVVVCIAFSPTQLKFPTLCAIAVLLIPTNSEVFAVSEYTFWWGSLLCIIPLLWTESNEEEYTGTRVSMVVLGGLSSPIIIGITILYALRLKRYRTKADAAVFCAAIATSTVQIASILYTGNLSHSPGVKIGLMTVLEKYFGFFVIIPSHAYDAWESVPVGISLILFIILASYNYRKKLGFGYFALSGCLVLAIAASLTRVSVDIIHPVYAGPRYFFLPYIFLSWILLQLAAVGRIALRTVVVLVFVCSLKQAIAYGQRYHDTIDWKSEVINCAQSEAYFLPIHYDGHRGSSWHVQLSGTACRELISNSIYGTSETK